jgi:hypothetical protein
MLKITLDIPENIRKSFAKELAAEITQQMSIPEVHTISEAESAYTPKYLTFEQCAKILSVSKPTLRNFIRQGILPVYSLNSKKKYLKLSDIESSLVQVPIPSKVNSYEDFERNFRYAVLRGRSIESLQKEFLLTDINPKNISAFCKWLWEYKRINVLNAFRGAIQIGFNNNNNL